MYKIGSFNCQHLSMARTKDIDVFIDIILKERYDIIALQEVAGKAGLNRLLERLPPTNWQGVADESSNGYAFLWNTERFELAHTETEEKGERVYAPRIYKQYKVDRKKGQQDLVREPFYARFFPVRGLFIELRLINVHIRFSKGMGGENDQSLGTIQKRKNEFDILTRAIYPKEEDKRYGNNRPAYTILLGDYNLNLPSSDAFAPYLIESFEISDGNGEAKVIRTIQAEKTTLRKEIKEGEDPFANNYDHFTIDENRFRGTSYHSERVDAVKKYYKKDYEKYKKEVSDHVPIIMKWEVNSNVESH